MTEKNSQCTRILDVVLFPSAAVKQKAKDRPGVDGRGIGLRFSKTQPVCFGFCVRLVCAGCLAGKDRLLFLLAFKRKKNQRMHSMCF